MGWPDTSKPLRLKRSKILSRCAQSSLQAAGAYGGYTSHQEIELAGVAVAIRIIVPNLVAGTPLLKASFAFDSTQGAINSSYSKGNGLTYTNFTFAGAASANHVTTISASRPTYLISDWMAAPGLARTDGHPGSLLHLRMSQGASGGDGATWYNGLWIADTSTEAVALHKWRCYRSSAAADYVSTATSSFNANSGNATSGVDAVIVQYAIIGEGISLIALGDSITSGMASGSLLTANSYGFCPQARDLLTSDKLPVEFCSIAWTGQTHALYAQRYADLAGYFKNTNLIYAAFTPNTTSSPMTQANITDQKGLVGLSSRYAEENNTKLIFYTGLPANASVANGGSGGTNTKAWNAGDSYRREYNAELLMNGSQTFDLAGLVAGDIIASGTSAGQQEYNQTYTVTDGLHLNNAGYAIGGVGLARYLRQFI